MVTPSSSSSSAEAANAIFGKWREYALALHNWLKSVRAEAEPRSVHGSRTAQRKTHYRKLWNELTSMVGNCDVETAEMALQRITECRESAQHESAQHDIDQIEAQDPLASGLQRLQEEVDAADWIIPYLEERLKKNKYVNLAQFGPVTMT